MFNYYKKYKTHILNLSLKKIYRHFFLNDLKPTGYYSYIKNEIFEFLKSKYPDYEKEVFDKKLNELINGIDDYRDITSTLNILFNPKLFNTSVVSLIISGFPQSMNCESLSIFICTEF